MESLGHFPSGTERCHPPALAICDDAGQLRGMLTICPRGQFVITSWQTILGRLARELSEDERICIDYFTKAHFLDNRDYSTPEERSAWRRHAERAEELWRARAVAPPIDSDRPVMTDAMFRLDPGSWAVVCASSNFVEAYDASAFVNAFLRDDALSRSASSSAACPVEILERVPLLVRVKLPRPGTIRACRAPRGGDFFAVEHPGCEYAHAAADANARDDGAAAISRVRASVLAGGHDRVGGEDVGGAAEAVTGGGGKVGASSEDAEAKKADGKKRLSSACEVVCELPRSWSPKAILLALDDCGTFAGTDSRRRLLLRTSAGCFRESATRMRAVQVLPADDATALVLDDAGTLWRWHWKKECDDSDVSSQTAGGAAGTEAVAVVGVSDSTATASATAPACAKSCRRHDIAQAIVHSNIDDAPGHFMGCSDLCRHDDRRFAILLRNTTLSLIRISDGAVVAETAVGDWDTWSVFPLTAEYIVCATPHVSSVYRVDLAALA